MSTLAALEKLVREHPDSKAAVGILAEWWQDYHDVPVFAALRNALAVKRAVKNAEQMKLAAELLKIESAWCWWLSEEISQEIKLAEDEAMELYLCPGSRPPQVMSRQYSDVNMDGFDVVVKVGARWVIAKVESVEVSTADFLNEQDRCDSASQ